MVGVVYPPAQVKEKLIEGLDWFDWFEDEESETNLFSRENRRTLNFFFSGWFSKNRFIIELATLLGVVYDATTAATFTSEDAKKET